LSLLINCTQDSNAARASAFLSVHFCQRRRQPSVRARFAGVSVMAGSVGFLDANNAGIEAPPASGIRFTSGGVCKERSRFERPYRGFDRALLGRREG